MRNLGIIEKNQDKPFFSVFYADRHAFSRLGSAEMMRFLGKITRLNSPMQDSFMFAKSKGA